MFGGGDDLPILYVSKRELLLKQIKSIGNLIVGMRLMNKLQSKLLNN
jgi:hypothetical protein